MSGDYQRFLESKTPRPNAVGIPTDADSLSGHMFDFQRACTAFCLTQGRAGLFLDTGLGKTTCELEFASRAMHHVPGGRALILTPLAVARQIEREAQRFGYDARVIRDQSEARAGINICNYDRLDKIEPEQFGVCVLDESSILKSFNSKTSAALIAAFRDHRFKLSATATPAPNDHMELGQHSAFVGEMTSMEMLSMFFINDTSTASQQWRLKGHAETAFWDWMASWSRMAQSPEDLGFDGSRFILPPMNIIRHKAAVSNVKQMDGTLFAIDMSATSMFDVKRQTAGARADVVATLATADATTQWLLWCDTNDESGALASRIPDAIEVRGNDSVEQKEERLLAFANGQARVLIVKPSIAGQGLNFQNCSNMAFVGRSFSYESWYQAVRRCWRFGQTKSVNVHLVVAEGEDQIGRVIDRKSEDHERMKRAMAAAMKRAMGRATIAKTPYNPQFDGRLPKWLKSAA